MRAGAKIYAYVERLVYMLEASECVSGWVVE